MDPLFVALGLIGGIVGLEVLAFARKKRREAHRTAALKEWAAGVGLSIEPGPKPPEASGLPEALLQRPVFSRGNRPQVANVMEGRAAEGRVVILDHAYVTGRKNSTTVSQTLVAIELPTPDLPEFVMSPENVFSKIGQVFGSQDVDFDSSPRFSSNYQLKGLDEDAIRSLFERNAVAYLSENPGWSVEASGPWIVAYRYNHRAKVSEWSTFFEEALTVIRVIATGTPGSGPF